MVTTLKRTLRSLRRSPGFVAVASLSLALGLGLTTSTYAIMDSMLRPKIPVPNLDRLFYPNLRLGNQKNPPPRGAQMEALQSLPGVERVVLDRQERTQVVVGQKTLDEFVVRVSPDFIAALGVTAERGRLPTPAESRTGSVAVLTADRWKRLFPERNDIEGAALSIDGQVVPVVGVLARGVERLYGGVLIPTDLRAEFVRGRSPALIVELRAGVDTVAIRPQLATLAARFTADYAAPGVPAYELRLKTLRPRPANLRDNEMALLMVGVAIGVLAIACANVASLALARGLTRRRDHALRVALGASRLAIGGEVLSEVAVIGVLGLAGGFALAVALVGILTHIVPEDMTDRGFLIPELNARVFVLSALTLLGGIVIAGAIPAWRASRADPSDPLKDNAGTTTGRARGEFKVLVIGELALAMALLMLASLMQLSTRNLLNYDFGFDAHRLLRAGVFFGPPSKDSLPAARRVDRAMSLVRRVQAMPGVAAVALYGGGTNDQERVTSDVRGEAQPLPLKYYVEAGAGYFATLGLPMLEGRDISEGDMEKGAVVLSQRASRLLFPHGGAVGRMVKLGGERSSRPWLPVVGVVRNLRLGLSSDPSAGEDTLIYANTPGRNADYVQMVVRPVKTDPTLSVEMVTRLRDGLSPRGSASVGKYIAYYDYQVRTQVFFDRLFSFLGAASLFLGAVGLFSVMSYAVSQRLREFAVRQALGAAPRDVLRLVMRGAFELALGGTAIGALLSFWASAGVSMALFGVKNTDPVSLVIAEAALLAVTMGASLVPAVRAMRADPVEVLRAT